MDEEKEVRWGQIRVGQTIKFWSHATAQTVEAELEGVRITISLHQNTRDDNLFDFYLNAVIESMNAVLNGFGLQLRHRGEFFINHQGVEEELTEDHPFVATILADFWGGKGNEWTKTWGDFALTRDFTDEYGKCRLLENGQPFEPYISYIVEAI